MNARNLSPRAFLLLLMTLAVPATVRGDWPPGACTVSALNRTARVDPSKGWALGNVPAARGATRVRATCVAEAGVVSSGQSDWLEILANDSVHVGQVSFDTAAPIPARLVMTAPSTRLTTPGESVQLAVAAELPDGSTIDVTGADTGTGYRTSNPGILSVDVEGMVTAVTSGRAVVSALNEGGLAVLQFEIVLSGDSDGDGLPDDWEIANGFNPNDPADGLEDQDEDGLSTFEEFQAGTDPLVADTDGDGLFDGEEIDVYATNPLLWDTDGDGISDGLEVETGSDPLDPSSFNLAGALVNYEVSPPAFRLVYNTVFGESFRTLEVTGTLRDGRTIDLTRRSYGTQYSSSDFVVANFGAEDGRVYAGQAGFATINVSTVGFSAASLVEVEVFSPTALSWIAIPGYANALDLSGGYAFIAAGSTGLQVVDVADPGAPFMAAALDTPGIAGDVRIVGDLALVADGAAGLRAIDVVVPTAPVELGAVTLPDEAYGVDADGDLAVVAANTGLAIVDISVPTAPVEVGWLPLPGVVRHVELEGALAYVSSFGQGITLVDVSNPAAPEVQGDVDLRPGSSDKPAGGLVVREGIAHVADGFAGKLGGLAVVDAGDPVSPGLVARSSDSFGLTEVALEGPLAFAADYLLSNDVPIFRVGEGAPVPVGLLDFPRSEQGTDIAVREGLVYLTGAAVAASPRLRPGVTTTSALAIGRYARLVPGDGDPPVVSFVLPAEGDALEERNRATIAVDVVDASRIDAVTLDIDGTRVGTDFRAPYSFEATTPSGAGPVELRAVARDEAGNEREAIATYPRLPNDRPVVWLVSPAEGQSLPKGSWYSVVAGASDDQAVSRVEIRINGGLVATRTSPPYRYESQVHPATEAESLTISVQSFDALGVSESVSRTVSIVPDAPPIVAVTAPAQGGEVAEGGIFQARVSAVDDVRVTQIRLYVDGAFAGTSGQSEREFGVYAEPGATMIELRAEATDNRDQVGTSEALMLEAVPDPGTSISGRVVGPSGNPVLGAIVAVETDTQSFGQATDGFGIFEVSGVPSIDGDLRVSATAELEGVAHSASVVEPLVPDAGGLLEVGDLILAPADGTATVTGRTVDVGGAPLAGVEVFVFDLYMGYETVSGTDGWFSIPSIELRDGYNIGARLLVGDTLWMGTSFVEPAPGGSNVGNIYVEPWGEGPDLGTTTEGAVFFVDTGEPAANLPVQVSSSYSFVRTVTNADGEFTVPAPAREGWLWAAAEATVAGTRYFDWAEAEPTEGGTTTFGLLALDDDFGIPHFVDPLRSRVGRRIGSLARPPRLEGPACVAASTLQGPGSNPASMLLAIRR